MTQIHFVGRHLASHWSDLSRLDETSITTQAERFRGGINNWIIQTYLHLKEPLAAAGIKTTIGELPIAQAINITHRDTLKQFFGRYRHFYTVGIRADRAPIKVCDWEILQNDLHVEHAQQRHIPLWPQPGMIPRDPARGDRIERIAYFGRTGTISEWLQSPFMQTALQELGVTFEIREDRWFDYSNVDLVLAHRHEAPTMLEQKPPSKLINAWHAGTPALLGYEPAFERLRRSRLDYFSANSVTDVIAVICKLKSQAGLYRSMIENGKQRSQDFSAEATRQRWLDFLLNDVVPDAQRTFEQGCVNRHGVIKPLVQGVSHKLMSRLFKLRCAWEMHCIEQGYELVPQNRHLL